MRVTLKMGEWAVVAGLMEDQDEDVGKTWNGECGGSYLAVHQTGPAPSSPPCRSILAQPNEAQSRLEVTFY